LNSDTKRTPDTAVIMTRAFLALFALYFLATALVCIAGITNARNEEIAAALILGAAVTGLTGSAFGLAALRIRALWRLLSQE